MRLLLLVAVAAGSARADTDGPAREGELSLRFVPGWEVSVRMTPHRIVGPTVGLVRSGDRFEGQIGRSAASLRLTREGLFGSAREGTVSLYAERDTDTVVVRGTYGAGTPTYPDLPARPRTARVEFGRSSVRIQAGACALELERKGTGAFRGGGFCGSSYRDAELVIDDALWSVLHDEPELVGLMVLESTLALH